MNIIHGDVLGEKFVDPAVSKISRAVLFPQHHEVPGVGVRVEQQRFVFNIRHVLREGVIKFLQVIFDHVASAVDLFVFHDILLPFPGSHPINLNLPYGSMLACACQAESQSIFKIVRA